MTTRQQEVLGYIRKRQRIESVGPTLREVAAHFGVAANAVQQQVKALRKAGEIKDDGGFGLVVREGIGCALPNPTEVAHLAESVKQTLEPWSISVRAMEKDLAALRVGKQPLLKPWQKKKAKR